MSGASSPRSGTASPTAVPDRLRHLPLVDAYAALLADADPAVREHAAREWCAWEDAHVSLTPGHQPEPALRGPGVPPAASRAWSRTTGGTPPSWRRTSCSATRRRLNGIPGVLIHGRYDVSGPLETAWRLSQRWTHQRAACPRRCRPRRWRHLHHRRGWRPEPVRGDVVSSCPPYPTSAASGRHHLRGM